MSAPCTIRLNIKGRASDAARQLLERGFIPRSDYREILTRTALTVDSTQYITGVDVDGAYGDRVARWYAETPNSPPRGGHTLGTLLHYRWNDDTDTQLGRPTPV